MHAWKRCEHGGLLYMNHGAKVMSRLKRWKKIYEDVGLSNDVHFRPLLESLNMYERNQNAVPAGVIHGDPVLTNIILHASSSSGHDKTDDEEEEEQVELKFIDMRGAQGNHLTLAGDAIYDLAKVFQSLLGYDFILGDVPFTSHAVDTLADLVNVFWKTVAQLYPSVQPKHILTVCAGLVTSLIPLHDNERHRARFAVIATELLRALQEEEEVVVVGNTMTMMTNGMQLSKSRDNSINKKGTVTTLLYAIAHQVDACA